VHRALPLAEATVGEKVLRCSGDGSQHQQCREEKISEQHDLKFLLLEPASNFRSKKQQGGDTEKQKELIALFKQFDKAKERAAFKSLKQKPVSEIFRIKPVYLRQAKAVK